ncbi:hypothetical protein DSO57_1006826 [Entomophthora muscae]|uniref:Uncharacterized protein n=1 Tax=Entomophthora muscae TaxID=34485 RepID=A0ACC2TUJ4_9FUNG|nr:hypothetical protein DSO57_1006826 [Entomophthora muscae]
MNEYSNLPLPTALSPIFSSYALTFSLMFTLDISTWYSLICCLLLIFTGTRNPSKKDIKAIESLMLFEKTSVLVQSYAWIKAWKSPYITEENMLLDKRGETELYTLGERTRSLYPSIFQFGYTPSRFAFHNSPTSRTSQSASAYSLGLFGEAEKINSSETQPVSIVTYPENEGFLLEPKSNCLFWKANVKGSSFKKAQIAKYIEEFISPIAKTLSEAINSTITVEDVQAIYKACAYEISLSKPTQWCSLLEETDILDLEYLEDLDYYFTYAYGNSINAKMSCSLISDFINKIEDYSTNDSPLLGDFQFGHSQTIQFLITALGLFKDEFNLTWDLDKDLKLKRDFKTSQISPFASNVFIETYRCGADLKVRFIVNEAPVKLPACSSIFCPFTELKEILDPLIGCSRTDLCSGKLHS